MAVEQSSAERKFSGSRQSLSPGHARRRCQRARPHGLHFDRFSRKSRTTLFFTLFQTKISIFRFETVRRLSEILNFLFLFQKFVIFSLKFASCFIFKNSQFLVFFFLRNSQVFVLFSKIHNFSFYSRKLAIF